ncbi:DUF255 domain-containing protein [Ancylomarina euxinus]|uniref:DUF255 domain-containing protein n=1 Tax=Ancylomarina euxinus TaxID=2283627 RepID=A0A425Y072_9BACT|nr:thioredoxin domain-containing protein [Ancylomarina euxinus]MCZ4695399.1 thioredoxin domain-containing protein [Ancylomarina euxinus]MUP15595.1 DUF255 domain-containing protein [Ancylomarina euxinus]RRG20964.1 DUF255 domain-containing protein [Ancylomarina euxinus]
MNKIKTILVYLSFCLFLGQESYAQLQSDNKDQAGIKFEHSSWLEILKKAKNENKLIFIDAYTTWCGPCKMMAKNVFTDAEVGDFFTQNFVNVKLDMEKEPGLSLKSKLRVTAYPTLIFVDANEKIVHKAVGSLPKDEFLKLGNDALNGEMNLSDYNAIYEKKGASDYEFLVGYLKMLESAGEKVKLKEVFVKYFDDLDSEKLLSQENWDLVKKYILNTDNKAFQYLLTNREQFESMFGEKEVGEKIYYTFLRQGNQLCDKTESGDFQLNLDRKSQFEADLEKFNIKDKAKILAYSEISTARSLEDWKTFVSIISKYLESGLIDKSVMSLYNYALPVNASSKDKELRAEAAKWCDMSLATENLASGWQNAFVKLKADLLGEK